MGKIFKEFITYVNKKISDDASFPKEYKENIMDHVYNYIMRHLHSKYACALDIA